jgi:hypothetical protein
VRETRDELLGDAKSFGARPGIIATLHTWSQTLVWHPHRHGLVTGGRVTDQGEWRAVSNGLLLPVRGVMAVFRGQLLAALETAVHEGTLTLPDGMAMRHWATLRHQRGRQQWNVHIRERYPHGAGVLTYSGSRADIGDHLIVFLDGQALPMSLRHTSEWKPL